MWFVFIYSSREHLAISTCSRWLQTRPSFPQKQDARIIVGLFPQQEAGRVMCQVSTWAGGRGGGRTGGGVRGAGGGRTGAGGRTDGQVDE